MALPDFTMRQLLKLAFTSATRPTAGTRGWALHLRQPQRHPHHRPVADRAAARPGARAVADAGPRAAACSSSAPSARRRSRSPTPPSGRPSITSTTAGSAACSPTGRPFRTRSSAAQRRRDAGKELRPDQEGNARVTAPGEARQGPRRHPRHGRHARPAVRDRHEQGGDRDRGSQRLGIPVIAVVDTNSTRRRHLPDPGQRRRGPRGRLYCDLISRACIEGISCPVGLGRRHRRAEEPMTPRKCRPPERAPYRHQIDTGPAA